jgi:DedD protein
LGAYSEPGRVKILLTKLKDLGVPAYTEKVETPSGARTRVRAGPFGSQEAAEKAKARIKIIGVDGPVARKP